MMSQQNTLRNLPMKLICKSDVANNKEAMELRERHIKEGTPSWVHHSRTNEKLSVFAELLTESQLQIDHEIACSTEGLSGQMLIDVRQTKNGVVCNSQGKPLNAYYVNQRTPESAMFSIKFCHTVVVDPNCADRICIRKHTIAEFTDSETKEPMVKIVTTNVWNGNYWLLPKNLSRFQLGIRFARYNNQYRGYSSVGTLAFADNNTCFDSALDAIYRWESKTVVVPDEVY